MTGDGTGDHGTGPYGLLHWDALLIGCMIAIRPFTPPRWALWAAGLVVVAQVGWYLSLDGDAPQTSIQYLLFAGTGAVMVSGAPRVTWLGNRTLMHFGTISYGLYLWHAVIFRLAYPPLVAIALSVGMAEVSWHLVEHRFLRPRHNDLKRADDGRPLRPVNA